MGVITSGIKKFFLGILSRTTTWIISSIHLEPNDDPETESHDQQGRRPAMAVQMLMQWEETMLTFCLASAIAIATVSVQIGTKLSLMFHMLSVALMACFTFTASAKLITNHERVSQTLYCVGGFWFVTAFFVAIAIPHALHFQIITLAIYLIFLAINFICYFS